jgi:hypothetical protein
MTVIQILPWLSTHGKKGISPQHGRMASVHNQRIWVFAIFFCFFWLLPIGCTFSYFVICLFSNKKSVGASSSCLIKKIQLLHTTSYLEEISIIRTTLYIQNS